ncbi:hypothetical protein GCM10022222_37660 [Amycolatopsis ultiminotia]|uniref:Lipoprotein n=1 Tax=Amycolatopsis ultiminotia TaxID=543629 RepID=A0ABP6WHE0_9PSEU
MKRSVPAALLGMLAVAVGGCSSAAPQGGSIPSHQPSVVKGPSGTVDIVVAEPASRADRAVRYFRLEDDQGKTLLEREFRTAPAELSAPLAVGRYRTVTWTRDCAGACRGVTDATLGRATGICGTRITISNAAATRVSVSAPSGVDCSMRAG